MRVMTWETKNFGDRLNDYVWKSVCPEILSDDDEDLLVGIGSLLNQRLPLGVTKYICGAGIGHGDMPTMDASWKIMWVRGPLTAELLGIESSYAIADGALLMSGIIPVEHNTKTYECSFMPHITAMAAGAGNFLKEECESAGLHLISPLDSVERVVHQIAKSEKLVTEALHGSIIADLLRVPWIPVARYGVLALKWRDWCESVGMDYRPATIRYRPQWHSSRRPPRMSRKLVFPFLRFVSKRLLLEQLARMRRDMPGILTEPGVCEEKNHLMRRKIEILVDMVK